MSDYEGEGDREEIFSNEVYQLVIAEAGVGGSNSKKNDRQQGGFCHKIYRCKLWDNWYVVGP